MNILEQIVAQKKIRISELPESKSHLDIATLSALRKGKNSFYEAIKKNKYQPGVIAEVKRKSPSKGVLRKSFDAVEIAMDYEANGACAISVLTEKDFFGGSIDDLKNISGNTNIPILRKDFIIDPVQITEAAEGGADAVLLIAAILNDDLLKSLYDYAQSIGLDVLLEVHSEKELHALDICPNAIVGINNRDLETFDIDLNTTEQLIKKISKERLVVSESGIKDSQDLSRLHHLGVKAVLVGEALMRAARPGFSLKMLIKGFRF